MGRETGFSTLHRAASPTGRRSEISSARVCPGRQLWRWSGTRTESICRRYAIVDEVMLKARPSRAKSLKAGEKRMVGWDGIEPPTPGFSDLGLGLRKCA
jgi:hypothetical protein